MVPGEIIFFPIDNILVAGSESHSCENRNFCKQKFHHYCSAIFAENKHSPAMLNKRAWIEVQQRKGNVSSDCLSPRLHQRR